MKKFCFKSISQNCQIKYVENSRIKKMTLANLTMN